jgi:hypothetical protein
LFLEASIENIKVLKWTLLGSKNLSEINFTKSELMSLNLTKLEGSQLAEQLGCKVSSLLLMYLGIHLYWKKLSVDHWNFFD